MEQQQLYIPNPTSPSRPLSKPKSQSTPFSPNESEILLQDHNAKGGGGGGRENYSLSSQRMASLSDVLWLDRVSKVTERDND